MTQFLASIWVVGFLTVMAGSWASRGVAGNVAGASLAGVSGGMARTAGAVAGWVAGAGAVATLSAACLVAGAVPPAGRVGWPIIPAATASTAAAEMLRTILLSMVMVVRP